MIVDRILDRKDYLEYDAKAFYLECLKYGEVGENIARAMDFGTEEDVKNALCQYIKDNEYNLLLMDYINKLTWLTKSDPLIEKQAADDFNEDSARRNVCVEKIRENYFSKPPEGKENLYAFECGVLLPPTDADFGYYSVNNPALPYGFYDEDQGFLLNKNLFEELDRLSKYVLNGVDGTYAIISCQGLIDKYSLEYQDLANGKHDLDIEEASYTFFKRPNEIVWSCCKIDGKYMEGFLEEQLQELDSRAKIYKCRAAFQHDNLPFAEEEIKLQTLSALNNPDCSLINFQCVEENKAEVGDEFPDDYIFTFEFYIKVPVGAEVDINNVLKQVDGGELIETVRGVPSLDEVIKTSSSKVSDNSKTIAPTNNIEL